MNVLSATTAMLMGGNDYLPSHFGVSPKAFIELQMKKKLRFGAGWLDQSFST